MFFCIKIQFHLYSFFLRFCCGLFKYIYNLSNCNITFYILFCFFSCCLSFFFRSKLLKFSSRRHLFFIQSFLFRIRITQNAELERASKNVCDHTHILLLKIISAKPLCQILTGHLFPGSCFDFFCKLFNCHIFSA